jgi:polar amino acid transport system substrate-binding protein
MRRHLIAVSLVFALAAWATAAQRLLPTGKLRVAFLGTNPVQGRIDPQTTQVIGPVGDLTPALARRLGVPFEITPLPNAASVITAVNDGRIDVGYLAFERERAAQVDYTEPYARMGNAYLVLASGPIQHSADVDRDGVVVGAVRGQSQQAWVSEQLRRARIEMVADVPPYPELVGMLTGGRIQAFAANRQRMEDTAKTDSRVRVLPDNFSTIPQAMVVRKGAAALLAELNRFVADSSTMTLVRESLARAHLSGVQPARP